MYLPKSDIFSQLNDLKTINYVVTQSSQNIFNHLPTVTFRVGNNRVNLHLNGDINYQDIEIILDIWALDSVTASNVLKDVEQIMRCNYYTLVFSADLPDPNGLFHINTRFKAVY